MNETVASIERTLTRARARLVSERGDHGHWVGELSSSALSTATATAALVIATQCRPSDAERCVPLIAGGRAWLAKHQNEDGGWGDTVDSPTNVSTTTLAWMALGATPGDAIELELPDAERTARQRAECWLEKELGGVDPERFVEGLTRVYGDDKTFAVPILVACAIGGVFGEGRSAWRRIPGLPFELAALPQGLFRFLGLPVVSYALPALIAIGQSIHRNRPSRNPLARAVRNATSARTLRVLANIQPTSGGFLEATPLTSFVLQSLFACGEVQGPVVERGLAFLVASVREDGSWPIDTDLATWVTTLSINALAGGGALERHLAFEDRARLREWLLFQQYEHVHPYTGAAPGAWAWTDLPGGVPDADDTPGALLALCALGAENDEESAAIQEAAARGMRWLVDLQNRDGGIPTFCRGWGTLPFDQSCPDLTAHALRAWRAWRLAAPASLARDVTRARLRAERHLVRTQRSDGAWVPLWFGNQGEARLENPLYGTSRVLRACPRLGSRVAHASGWREALGRGLDWILGAQAAGGGFGGGPDIAPSIEETGLALEALADAAATGLRPASELGPAIASAAAWLARATEEGERFPTQPIGLYFARLWYWERLYPLVFTVSALERSRRFWAS